jgi:hypothetical protein
LIQQAFLSQDLLTNSLFELGLFLRYADLRLILFGSFCLAKKNFHT